MCYPVDTIPFAEEMKTRVAVDLQALVEFLQEHCDKLGEETKVAKKIIDR